MNYLYPVKEEYFDSPPLSSSSSPTSQNRRWWINSGFSSEANGGASRSRATPFLTKTYDAVEDPTTSHIVSWSRSIPLASLQTLTTAAIVLFSPIYDRLFVLATRAITSKPSSITMLQRIGTGIFISVFTVVFAALVETKRLKTAQESGVVDEPKATVSVSIRRLKTLILI